MTRRNPWVVLGVVVAVLGSAGDLHVRAMEMTTILAHADRGRSLRKEGWLPQMLTKTSLAAKAMTASSQDQPAAIALLRTWRSYLQSLNQMDPDVRKGWEIAIGCAWVEQSESERALGVALHSESEASAIESIQGLKEAAGVDYASAYLH